MTPGLPDIVIPTAGRPELATLLRALADVPARVIVVDDRPGAPREALPAAGLGAEVLRSGGRGPAAARNVGWRAARTEWVAFLDDDVVPPPWWAAALGADLAGLPPRTVASQGWVRVPVPVSRASTDWERNVAGLAGACWATADLAVRRAALLAVGGFDERFPRAYREDADLALRLRARGLELVRGARRVDHPVGSASRWVSLAKQRGNADDALMGALHGRGWRERADAPPGRLGCHVATTAAGALALGVAAALAAGSGASVPVRRLTAGAAATWLAYTAELAWARIAPGPRTREEVLTMLTTSVAMPPVAVAHRLRGELRARRIMGRGGPVPAPPLAVLLDRDDTLIEDVPYNGRPELVEPRPGVRAALDRLRARGARLAIVSNQSGIARGLLTEADVRAVSDRVVALIGPFDDVRWCPHGPDDGCACRKPRPGMLLDAAAAVGVDPLRCAMVGDIGADVEAARNAGMRGILVPTARTRAEEVAAAPEVAATFAAAVDLLLAGEDPDAAAPPLPLAVPAVAA